MLPYWLIDAFADAPFTGNPAMVVALDGPRDDRFLQALATEFNQSETAYLRPLGEAWELRWFTPTCEVDLCGHATLAAAVALRHGGLDSADLLTFQTRSGIVRAAHADGAVLLDFPVVPIAAGGSLPEDLDAHLGVRIIGLHRAGPDLLVEVDDAESVRSLSPDLEALRGIDARGICVHAAGEEGFDVCSRFFAPAFGIPEDPVTGSAHCALGPLWARRLGRPRLRCRQLSRRGGTVQVHVQGDRVGLGGAAVLVAEGRLRI